MMCLYMPLQIVGSGISVLLFWTEWTDIAGAFMNKAMANHLILSFEPFTAFTAWAVGHRAKVRSVFGMDIGMRIEEVLSGKRGSSASFLYTFETSSLW